MMLYRNETFSLYLKKHGIAQFSERVYCDCQKKKPLTIVCVNFTGVIIEALINKMLWPTKSKFHLTFLVMLVTSLLTKYT